MPDQPVLLQIGAVAELTELSIVTLRHYDEVGLVPPSARSEGGFRLYTSGDVERLRTIRRMKPLGFTLDQMRELLAAVDAIGDPSSSKQARTKAQQTLRECIAATAASRVKLERNLAYADELDTLLHHLLPFD